MIKIILADDHMMVCDGIMLLLEKDQVFEVAALAVSGEEVMEMLNDGLQADLILADVHMPVLSGIEMATCINASAHQIKIALFFISHTGAYVG